MTEQLQFPYASLDFPGCVVLTVDNVAAKLGLSVQHVLDEVTEGRLVALDLAGKATTRRYVRVPIESYRNWVLARLTAPAERVAFIRTLPRETQMQLLRELREALGGKA